MSVAIAMDGSLTEPTQEDEEVVCSRTKKTGQEPKGTGECVGGACTEVIRVLHKHQSILVATSKEDMGF